MTAVALSPLQAQRQNALLNMALFSLVVLFLLLKARLLFLQNINWDEFLFLSRVHEAIRGDLAQTLQTAYVHAFTWLQYIPGNEIEQIFAARLVMLALQAGTAVFICLIGRRLMGTTEGLLSALLYLTFSYNMDHGTSFRADPIAVFLITGALWLLVRDKEQMVEIFGASILIAVAGMITIKSIFYAPTLAIAVLCFRGQRFTRDNIKQLIVLGLSSLVLFIIFYQVHDTLAVNNEGYSVTERIGSSSNTVFSAGFNPRASYLWVSFWHNTVEWYAIIVGLVLAITALVRPKPSRTAIGIVALALPLVTLLFYRNSFPYYYVFILGSGTLLGGFLAHKLKTYFSTRAPQKFHAIIAIVAVLLLGKMLVYIYQQNSDQVVAQRQLIDMVHRIFPEPVAYIDRNSMISSYPKKGFFMSTWGMETYNSAGEPIMEELIRQTQPVFLLENTRALQLENLSISPNDHLFPEDTQILREHFIPHWGLIRVLGKQIDLDQPGLSYTSEILVAGTYTVEAEGPVHINSQVFSPGDTVDLAAGYHSFESEISALSVTLRWGDNLYMPSEEPSQQRLFKRFLYY
jgi:hypothetical protein